VKAKGIENIFNKIIGKNYKILRKNQPYHYRKLLGHATDNT
jgi:hypothetical protein